MDRRPSDPIIPTRAYTWRDYHHRPYGICDHAGANAERLALYKARRGAPTETTLARAARWIEFQKEHMAQQKHVREVRRYIGRMGGDVTEVSTTGRTHIMVRFEYRGYDYALTVSCSPSDRNAVNAATRDIRRLIRSHPDHVHEN